MHSLSSALHPSMGTLRREWRSAARVAAAVALVLTLAGCASSTGSTATGGELGPTTVSARATGAAHAAELAIASDYGSVRTIAVDGRGGVWAWASRGDESHVWYAAANGAQHDWTVGTDARFTAPFAPPALAACGARAWLGINDVVVPLDPDTGTGTGTGKVIDLPASTSIPEVDAHRPAELQGRTAVDTLACSGDRLAVGFAGADHALLLDTTTGTSASIKLPPAGEAVTAAFSQDGTAAFGIQDYTGAGPHTVLLVPAGSTTAMAITVGDAAHLLGTDDGFLTGLGAQHITVGATGPVIADTGLDTTSFNPMFPPVLAGPTNLLAPSSAGLAVVDVPSAAVVRTIGLGSVPCAPVHVPPTPNTTTTVPATTVPTTCQVTAVAVAASSNGTVAYVPSNSQGAVRTLHL